MGKKEICFRHCLRRHGKAESIGKLYPDVRKIGIVHGLTGALRVLCTQTEVLPVGELVHKELNAPLFRRWRKKAETAPDLLF